jgi:hypothetical protein
VRSELLFAFPILVGTCSLLKSMKYNNRCLSRVAPMHIDFQLVVFQFRELKNN